MSNRYRTNRTTVTAEVLGTTILDEPVAIAPTYGGRYRVLIDGRVISVRGVTFHADRDAAHAAAAPFVTVPA